MSSTSQDGNATAESRLSLLRELGEQAVLETIFRRGPITRPEIAIATELSKPTVSAAVSRLEQSGLIRATGRRTGQRGRNPVAYMVSKQVGFVVGGDIGGSNLRVAAADLFGEPICDLKQPTTKAGGRALGMQVLEMVTEVIDRAGATHGRPLALAISTPGIIDQSTGRVTSLAYNVAPEGGFDPVEVIRDRLEMPVLVENNVNLAAIGEKWFGLARGVSTMVFIAVGAGIGMGIVIDDQVVRGAHGAAGEIGYLPLAGDPFDPRHRLHGGLEDEIGAAGIVASFNERRSADDPQASAAQEVFELATQGNTAARAVVDHVAARLGTAIATVSAILDPELVVLGGGIGSSPLLLSPVRGAAASLVPITARIETSLLGDRAALQGAVAMALNTARTSLLSSGGAPPTRAQPALAAPRRG
jgi:predicted NBD/HSP70 family sugar kinase